jgi:hypothetical protein
LSPEGCRVRRTRSGGSGQQAELRTSERRFPVPTSSTTSGTMIDLSFLTEEEHETILRVLQRDAQLKMAEEKRIK